MTFEEWSIKQDYSVATFEELEGLLQAAWDAGYEECLNDNAEAGKIAFNTAYAAGYKAGTRKGYE